MNYGWSKRRSRRRTNRTGAILFGVIVALAVASALWFALVKTAVTERQVVRRQQWSVQASELAASGLERAVARLASDREYTGENWLIPATALDGRHAAAVSIEITADEAQPEQRAVGVHVTYPDEGAHRASQRLKTVVDL